MLRISGGLQIRIGPRFQLPHRGIPTAPKEFAYNAFRMHCQECYAIRSCRARPKITENVTRKA